MSNYFNLNFFENQEFQIMEYCPNTVVWKFKYKCFQMPNIIMLVKTVSLQTFFFYKVLQSNFQFRSKKSKEVKQTSVINSLLIALLRPLTNLIFQFKIWLGFFLWILNLKHIILFLSKKRKEILIYSNLKDIILFIQI